MKPFDLKLVPESGMAVLTAPEIEENGTIYLADFRDVMVLVYKPTGNPIGFSRQGGMRLGKTPMRMVNGLWQMDENLEIQDQHKDVTLRPELLELRPL